MNKVQSNLSDLEVVCIVNGKDEIQYTTPRSEMRDKGLLHRVTYILVFNSRGDVLVQTRTKIKDWYPGYFDLAAGGVMTIGEEYIDSAKRELKEELGIVASLNYEFKIYFEDNQGQNMTRSWGKVYSCISDGPFALQKEEVAEVCFMSVGEVFKLNPLEITPDSRLVFHSYLMSEKPSH